MTRGKSKQLPPQKVPALRSSPTFPSLMKKRRFILLLTCLGLTLASHAQQRRVQNKPFIDERRFHYGFFVGGHDLSLDLQNNGFISPETGEQWVASTDRTNFGFSVGVLGEWKLTNHVALRLTPSLYFGSKHIELRERGSGETKSVDLKSCYLAVPTHFKIAAPRFNNYRPYVVAGVSPMYDLTTGKRTLIKTRPLTLMLEAGLGCDIYLPFFKFIPELKFSFGLNNVLQKTRNDLTDPTQKIYTQSIDKATLGMVTLNFYFE